MIVTVCSTKGGVGKTTLTANLAGLLADAGYRVPAPQPGPWHETGEEHYQEASVILVPRRRRTRTLTPKPDKSRTTSPDSLFAPDIWGQEDCQRILDRLIYRNTADGTETSPWKP